MTNTTLVPSFVPRPVFGFAFRNHNEHRSTTEPRFLGSDWTKLSDSGLVQRRLSGSDGGEIVVTSSGDSTVVPVPSGMIMLVEPLPEGQSWLVSIPRNDELTEIATDDEPEE